ncbi:hypothetical protein K438DRAFT_1988881 [Mycena galopus ATCC 62051]|nr:hypothetical protein K438DRAFT_1988881 [Mycena galopus ATCC 62051]
MIGDALFTFLSLGVVPSSCGTSSSAASPSRYLRLILMSALQVVCLAFTAYNLWSTLAVSTRRPYVSWAYVHAGFSHIAQFPMLFIPQEVETMYYAAWESLQDYKREFACVRRRFGVVHRTVLREKASQRKRGLVFILSFPAPPTPTKFRTASFDEVLFGYVSDTPYPYSSSSPDVHRARGRGRREATDGLDAGVSAAHSALPPFAPERALLRRRRCRIRRAATHSAVPSRLMTCPRSRRVALLPAYCIISAATHATPVTIILPALMLMSACTSFIVLPFKGNE